MPNSFVAPSRRPVRVLPDQFFTVLVLVVMAVIPAAALRINVPIGVRITAYVNQKPEGPNPAYDWKVSHRRDEVRLYIQKLLIKTGGVSPGQVDRAVYPYPIQFQLAGEDDAVQTLTSVAAGTRVTIDGYLQFAQGARIMMIDAVEVLEPPAPAKPAAATPKAP